MKMRNFIKSRKFKVILFCLVIGLMLSLRYTPLYPFYITNRKIIYILGGSFFLIFRINYRIIALMGLSLLAVVIVFALLGSIGFVNKLVVYAWGLLTIAVFFMGIEQFKQWKKR
jgi:hypothetical protein